MDAWTHREPKTPNCGDVEADLSTRYQRGPSLSVPRTTEPPGTPPTASRRRLSPEDTLALWQQYRATNDPGLRDRLILTFAPLVKYIVYKKVREMPARCEVEDFISCGLEA